MPKLNFVNALTPLFIADRSKWMPFPVADLPARCNLWRREVNGVVEYQLDPFEMGARPVESPFVASYEALKSLSSAVPKLRDATVSELKEVADPGETAIGIALDRHGKWLLFTFHDQDFVHYGPLGVHDDILLHHGFNEIADMSLIGTDREVQSDLEKMFQELSDLYFGLLIDLNAEHRWGFFDGMGLRIQVCNKLEAMVDFVVSGGLREVSAEAGIPDIAGHERAAAAISKSRPTDERREIMLPTTATA
jgi:hypothetical protein